jgi:hypothetical protein
MSSSHVRFATLRRFLSDRGFTERHLPTGHAVFEHRASGAVFLMPDLQPDEVVPLVNFMDVRKQLDERGVATADEVDRMGQKASA